MQYVAKCTFSAAWYICEDMRSAVSGLCPDLKCSVLDPPLEASGQQKNAESAGQPLVPRFDAETLERSHELGLRTLGARTFFYTIFVIAVQRGIFQSLPELTAEEEEAEQQKAAIMAEEAKRRRAEARRKDD